MVTQWQSLFYEDRFAHTHQKNPDFVKLAEAMGVQADRCVAPADVTAKLEWLLASDGPALLEVVTDKKVPVLPMVPAGKALHEFLVYDEGRTLVISDSQHHADLYLRQGEGATKGHEGTDGALSESADCGEPMHAAPVADAFVE